MRSYNLDKPLWVFVGSTVNAVYTKNRRKRSDVLTVARFLHRVLRERTWAVDTMEKLLKGESGLATEDGQDVFAGRFPYLKEMGLTPGKAYDDMLWRIFHARTGGGLHLADIRGSDGEIGLKAAGADEYFGLIYIGDTSAFKKLVESEAPEVTLEGEAVGGSLFNDINKPHSRIHILIGAKKFMEGWNSWRVSNMGLLNIGRSEGSQIIQLFGRGVRLRGKGFTLKRSAALENHHPEHISLLETLNIFAVRANYMAQFRDYLEREGVETEPVIELPLFTMVNKPALKKGLVVPRLPDEQNFADNVRLLLEPDEDTRVRVDLSVKVYALESTAMGLHTAQVQVGEARKIPNESLALVDWVQAYLDLLTYKERKGLTNIVIRPETPRQIIENVPYTLVADEAVVRPQTFAERSLLQEAVTVILRKYVDVYYRRKREQWETHAMEYRPLDANDPNLNFKPAGISEEKTAYLVKVPHSEKKLVEAIQKLLDEADHLYKQKSQELPRIHFDRHLYLPLLVEQIDQLKTIPPALNPNEAQFVRELKAYWEAEKDNSLAGKEVFLLRNRSRGRGIGFFEERGFYPDFILWVLDGSRQRIVFVEPHGMLHAKAYIHDEKARLHELLPELAKEIGRRSKRNNITLDAYIISATPYDELYKRYDDGTWDREKFAKKHILFPERSPDYDYINLLFADI